MRGGLAHVAAPAAIPAERSGVEYRQRDVGARKEGSVFNDQSSHTTRSPVAALAGLSAILGGALWVASVGWYAQQPIAEGDDLKEGWEAFNRLLTLIPVLFALPLYTMRIGRGSSERIPRSLLAVLVSIAIAAMCRLLVDLDLLPSPFALLAILLFSTTFLWYLIATLWSGKFSRPAVVVLLTVTLLMLAFIGAETNLIWFAAPFGVAWVAIGMILLTRMRQA